MLKSWTTCARCWSRRNFPTVIRWSSVERRNSICPFPDFLKRELISSLPVPSNTLNYTSVLSGMHDWPCGSMNGIPTSPMKPAPCPEPSPCLPWGWKENSGHRWWQSIWIYAMMSILPYKRNFSTPLSASSVSGCGHWACWCGAHYLCSGWSLPGNFAA